ncbi:MAG TPA: pseudouridine synthase [Clostridia bacterium]|nr:pseudouridine synthase [Clostridia bacterium]
MVVYERQKAMRLHKYMAECGVASRRAAEKMIKEGRVRVNDQVVTQLGLKINPDKDSVAVDNIEIRKPAAHTYIAFNKPPKVITTMKEQFGRGSVADYFKGLNKRVYPVGRLDYATEGLLLLTDDGELANRLMHPKYHVDKTYTARIRGVFGKDEEEALEKGIMLDGRKTGPADIKVLDVNGSLYIVRITISEGRNRQIRRMFESVGCKVEYLRRDSIGSIKLGELRPGKWRHLSPSEVEYLKKNAGLTED